MVVPFVIATRRFFMNPGVNTQSWSVNERRRNARMMATIVRNSESMSKNTFYCHFLVFSHTYSGGDKHFRSIFFSGGSCYFSGGYTQPERKINVALGGPKS